MVHCAAVRSISAALTGTFLLLASPPSYAAGGLHTNALVGGGPTQPALLPTGQYVTPLAAPGSTYVALRTGLRPDTNADANGAVTTGLSPDGKTLLVLCSGYNTGFFTPNGAPITTPLIDPVSGRGVAATTGAFEWVFVYDVSGGAPRKVQQIQLPNHPLDGLA